jgi:iron(III) transport system substrate-binding protein
MQNKLTERFPDYKIIVSYESTSNIATQIINAGSYSECDIIYAEEYGYLAKMVEEGVLAPLAYDLSIYTEEAITYETQGYTLPSVKTGGAVIINTHVLSRHNLSAPTCYEDLLDPAFNDLVSMPNPKHSGTGYMFYLSLVNEMGEQNATNYFNNLAPNVLQFTPSGSGPVNALVQREVAVGFGMISQAVEKIKNGNNELEILIFDEGAPFNLYGTSIVKGKENRESVKAVMDYFYSELINEICGLYYPETIIKNATYNVIGYPENLDYSDMSGNTLQTKERLNSLWSH